MRAHKQTNTQLKGMLHVLKRKNKIETIGHLESKWWEHSVNISAHGLSGNLRTDVDWYNAEEQWCQGDLWPVCLFMCSSHLPSHFAMHGDGCGSAGRVRCPLGLVLSSVLEQDAELGCAFVLVCRKWQMSAAAPTAYGTRRFFGSILARSLSHYSLTYEGVLGRGTCQELISKMQKILWHTSAQ